MPPAESASGTAAVTGSTGAIGKAIAAGLASLGWQVILIARDSHKLHQAAEEIKNNTGNLQVDFEVCDLSRESKIAVMADRWERNLDVLVNNAAVTPPTRQETPEGIELQFATNVLGYFWMTLAFQKILASSQPARIINVASYWAGGLEIADLEFTKRPYQNNQAYRQSKQANRMLTMIFAEKLRPRGITVNSCHPGDVNSTLSNNLGFGGSETPAQGAATPIWLATSPAVKNLSGKYFENKQEASCQFSKNKQAAQKLYQRCLSFTKLLG